MVFENILAGVAAVQMLSTLYSAQSLCRIVMLKSLCYTQYGLCVLSTGVAVAPILMLYSVQSLCRLLMSKFFCYTQYVLCVLSTGVAVAPALLSMVNV